MPPKIIDLSTAAPDPVIVRIGNGDDIEEIDLTLVPAAVSLRLVEATQAHGGYSNIPDSDLLPAIAAICKHTNPAVTESWLRWKCTREQLAALANVVFVQAFRVWKGGDGPKNPGSRWAGSSPASAPSMDGRPPTASGRSPGIRS